MILVVLVSAGGVGAWYYLGSSDEPSGEVPILQTVARGPFDHVVLEHGEIGSSSNVEINCEVKSRNTGGTMILEVVDEGTQVKEGDILVKLDSSALEREFQQQKVIVFTSESLVITARSAKEQAVVAKEEYIDGTFIQEKRQIESEILLAEEKVSRAEETAKFSERLAALGFQTDLQLKADKFAVQQATVELDLAEGRLKTLEEITRKKMLIELEAAIETANAKLESELSSHEEELDKLKEIEDQIAKCTIIAPQDGQVVHANRTSSRGNAEFVVEPGATVREGQAIIRLPDPDKMQIEAKINESRIPLVKVGMPVAITVGALEGQTLQGRVVKVNKYAEPTSWFSSQIKEYATHIAIKNPPESIRTGMTAEVRIFVEQLKDVLQMPIQALHEYKAHYFCLVHTGEGQYDTREIEIGSSNDSMVVVKSGLEEGELVVLNPRRHTNRMNLPDLPDPEIGTDEFEEYDPAASQPSPGRTASLGGGADGTGADGTGAGGLNAGGPGTGGTNAGGPGAGRARSGSPAEIVARMLENYDTDKDGQLSQEEIDTAPDRVKQSLGQADTNEDGWVDRTEMMAAMAKVIQRRQQGGSPSGGSE